MDFIFMLTERDMTIPNWSEVLDDLDGVGSIATPEQLVDLREAGVDGFTVGTAVFDGGFFPEAASLRDRVARIIDIAGN